MSTKNKFTDGIWSTGTCILFVKTSRVIWTVWPVRLFLARCQSQAGGGRMAARARVHAAER